MTQRVLPLIILRSTCLVDPEGKVVEAIWNEGTKHPHVKYYYSSPQECMFIFCLFFILFFIFEYGARHLPWVNFSSCAK